MDCGDASSKWNERIHNHSAGENIKQKQKEKKSDPKISFEEHQSHYTKGENNRQE